ncbi:MAG: bifunctional metallophosphatase/5'-nucleotidase, partial [Calditrichia bacterium]|nr:bifunctional metallophosphatase/5'-nucleotidase [Calditrichia bacterium]
MKQISILLLTIILITAGCSTERIKTEQLVIVETSDVHGALFSYDFLKDKENNRGYLAASHIID